MGYVVGKPIRVGDRIMQPGEPLPEAATWRNLDAYISGGYVMGFPDPPEERQVPEQRRDPEQIPTPAGRSQTEEKSERDVDDDEATGTGTPPTAAGRLREPVAGKILDTEADIRGVPVEEVNQKLAEQQEALAPEAGEGAMTDEEVEAERLERLERAQVGDADAAAEPHSGAERATRRKTSRGKE